jgi:geranylgeranyl pyrophosphate synthase
VSRGDVARAPVAGWLEATRAWTEDEIERELAALDPTPERLLAVIRYALAGGGKRLRPALVRLFCAHFGGSDGQAAASAVAIECVHTYSLIHDDLPCMDDDALRRGRPTCHVVFGEALAVLAGDALLTWAFELVVRGPEVSGGSGGAERARILARAAGPAGMVGGQVIDLAAPAVLSRELVAEIHERKTAALFGASAELGACAAGANADECRLARSFGLALGRCFQAIDDVLDVTGDAATLGKTPGKDARAAKPTLVAALGLEGARAEAARQAECAREAALVLGPGAGGSAGLAHALVEHLLARVS